MTHRQLPVTFRLEKSGVISPKNPWKYYIQGGYSSCGHMFWVISSQCPLGGGHLSCWRSSGCERHWGATIIEELEGLGTISMLFFLPLLTFSFFFQQKKRLTLSVNPRWSAWNPSSRRVPWNGRRRPKLSCAATGGEPGLGDPKSRAFFEGISKAPWGDSP